jgi:hypothetical protein
MELREFGAEEEREGGVVDPDQDEGKGACSSVVYEKVLPVLRRS